MAPTPPAQAATEMFEFMLDSAPVLPEGVHRAAWRAARNADHIALSRTLIARMDAPADLVEQYSTLTAKDLRAVYLSRPDVGADALAQNVAGETRASVLAEALTRTQRHPHVVQVARARFVIKPTKALAEHMIAIGAHDPSEDLAVGILRAYAKTDPDERLWLKDLAFMSELPHHRAHELLAEVDHPECVEALLTAPGGDDAVIEAATRVLTDFCVRAGRRPNDWSLRRSALEFARKVVRARTDPVRIADQVNRALAAAPDLNRELTRQIRDTLRDPQNHAARPWLVPRPAQPAQPAPPASAADTLGSLDKAALSQLANDTAHAEAVATVVLSNGVDAYEGTAAVANLLRNPALSQQVRAELLEAIDACAVPLHTLAQLDAVSLFRQDEQTVSVWCRTFPQAVLTRHGWEPFGGVTAAATLLPAWAQEDTPRSNALVDVAFAAGFDPQVLLDLPVAVVQRLFGYAGKEPKGAGPAMLAGATQIVADRLGSNLGRWETFTRLRGSFVGTFEELLDVCVATAS